MTIASVADFRNRATERSIEGLDDSFIQNFLDEAEAEILSLLSPRGYATPLTFVGGVAPEDLKGHQVRMALYRLMTARGFNQSSDAEIALRDNYLDAVKYLDRIAAGELNLDVTMVNTARRASRLAGVYNVNVSSPTRGWGDGSTT